MRTVSTDLFKQQFGLEPIIVVAIKLADWVYYGDRDHEKFRGLISDVQNIENVINISQNATTANVTIQFIDVDHELKSLYNHVDLHMKPLKIYQYFNGSDFDTDKILLFEGYIASPITYDEAQMTLTITGLSRLKNIEVGFSPDNAVWQHIIPNELEPEPWPMPFGTPINYPLPQITKEPIGTLVHGFGIPDFTSPAAYQARTGFAHGLYIRQTILRFGQQIGLVYSNWNRDTANNLQELVAARQQYLSGVMHALSERNNAIMENQQATARNLSTDASPSEVKAVAEDGDNAIIDSLNTAIYQLGGSIVIRSIEQLIGGPTSPEGLKQSAQVQLSIAQAGYNYQIQVLQARIQYHRAQAAISTQRQSAAHAEINRINAENQRQQDLMRQEQFSYTQQQQYNPVGKTISIFNGKRFPYDRDIWLKIGEGLVYGRFEHKEIEFDGLSNFKVKNIVHPRACDFLGVFCTELESARYQVFPHVIYGQYVSLQDGVHESWLDNISASTLPDNIIEEPDSWRERNLWKALHDEPNRPPGYNYIYPNDALKFSFKDWSLWFVGQLRGGRANFAWISAGSSVRLAFSNPVEYIIAIIPCEIITISAYRTYANAQHITPIPTSWYSIADRDYGAGLIAKVLTLQRPLDTLVNLGFGSTIFATVKSSIGPNVVDVIRYLIETYLPDVSCDEDSFNRVYTEVTDWPVNFVLTDRPTIANLLADICYQACIAIWQYDSTIYLRYLPNMPANSESITDEEMDIESLQLHYTETEDVVTKIIAEYMPRYDLDAPYRLAARYNTAKYGTTEETINYFIYNDREAVVHSVTFWLIRKANTWKYLEFSTALTSLVFDTMDAVKIQLQGDFVAYSPVIGLIEESLYDSTSFTINYRVWLPVRAGEMEMFKFAYLNIGDIDDEFPEPYDWVTGNGIGSPVIRDLDQGATDKIMGTGTVTVHDVVRMNMPVRPQPKQYRHQAEPQRITQQISGPTAIPVFPEIDPDFMNNYEPLDLTTPEPEPFQESEGVSAPDYIENTTLSLQRTLVYDSASGQTTALGAFFVGIHNAELLVRNKISVKAPEADPAPFEFMYDGTRNEYGAKLAFLAEPVPENEEE